MDAFGECEISIAVQNNIEAYMYRGTGPLGSEQQECWDFTENCMILRQAIYASKLALLTMIIVINNCIKNQGNKGWENGPDDFQYYELGFRPLNAVGSKHDPFSGNDYLNSSFSVMCASEQVYPPLLGSVDNVRSKAQEMCRSLASQKVVMNWDDNQLPTNFPNIFRGATSNGDGLVYSLVWGLAFCEDRNNPTQIDFSSYSQDQCVQNYVDQGAGTCPHGGSLSKDCARWTVNAFKSS
jgi:hypothetical protein